jgi:hypothetical protein
VSNIVFCQNLNANLISHSELPIHCIHNVYEALHQPCKFTGYNVPAIEEHSIGSPSIIIIIKKETPPLVTVCTYIRGKWFRRYHALWHTF